MIPEYTTVVGVDRKHLQQLSHTWPTWKRHKPLLLNSPMIIFYDYREVSESHIRIVVDHPQLTTVPWPFSASVQFQGAGTTKWNDPQRHKMLCGFVHVAAKHVRTPYWLKLDCDVVAVGVDDWIDPTWFDNVPAIVAHRWTFTKPPDQMDLFDQWVEENRGRLPFFQGFKPLNLHPASPESDRLSHKRIISWCGFFQTSFTCLCAHAAEVTCDPLHLPQPSQDGYMFYMAKRLELQILPVNMKKIGWQHWGTMQNVIEHSWRAMQ